MVPNEECHILQYTLNLQTEDSLYIKDKMPGPNSQDVLYIEVPLYIYTCTFQFH